MTSLSSLLGTVMVVLQASPLYKATLGIETDEFSPEQFVFKVRVILKPGARLQLRVYHNHGHMDYSYRLFTDVSLLRWDNKEEYPHLATHPHHHHDERGKVFTSPLTGDPLTDIIVVLREVTRFLETRQKPAESRRGTNGR